MRFIFAGDRPIYSQMVQTNSHFQFYTQFLVTLLQWVIGFQRFEAS